MNPISLILVLSCLIGSGMAGKRCTNQIFEGSQVCDAPDGDILYTYDSRIIAGQCLRCTCYPTKEGTRMYCCDHGSIETVENLKPGCWIEKDENGCNSAVCL